MDYNITSTPDSNSMTKTRAFISFDYDHDDDLRTLLLGQSQHPDSPFEMKDRSLREHLVGDWKNKVWRRFDNVDVVIVMCGESTHTAAGVAAELAIAKEKGTPYFLLWGRNGKQCTKPTTANTTDKIYQWTWDNLKALIGGAR